MRRRTRFLAVVVLGAVLAGACASSSGDDRTSARPEPTTPPTDVEVVTRTDDRIDAAIVMAGLLAPFSPGEYDLSGVPLLILHGDADPLLNIALDADAYAQVAPPKIFVTIHGGGHFQPFEDVVDPADAMVEAVTTDFWDVYLGGQPDAFDRLLADADVPGFTTVQHDAG